MSARLPSAAVRMSPGSLVITMTWSSAAALTAAPRCAPATKTPPPPCTACSAAAFCWSRPARTTGAWSGERISGPAADGDVVDAGLVGACAVRRQPGEPDDQVAGVGGDSDSSTVPPAPDDLATVVRSDGLGPARSSRSAPGLPPSDSRTEVTVTGRPMSTSRPVPSYRFPNSGVVYQSVRHGVAGLPLSASAACCGSSPPPGPNAATLAGVSAAVGVAAGEGVRAGAGEAEAGAGADPTAVPEPAGDGPGVPPGRPALRGCRVRTAAAAPARPAAATSL